MAKKEQYTLTRKLSSDHHSLTPVSHEGVGNLKPVKSQRL